MRIRARGDEPRDVIPFPMPVGPWPHPPESMYFGERCGRLAAIVDDVEETGLSEQQTVCPYPSRRDIHSRQGGAAPAVPPSARRPAPQGAHLARPVTPSSRSQRKGRRGVLKGGLLASLAAMTVAVPLSGFVGADSSVALPARSVGAVVGTSWSPEAAPQTSEALEGSQTAASRARVRAPLTLTTCLPSGESANGEREVEVDPTTIYRPLQEGTFEFASAFAWRVSPISGQLLQHEGVDLSAPLGTPIYSVYSGTVVEVAENSRSGAYVKIEHRLDDGTVFFSMYLHQYMSDILVAEGEEVAAGQRIGSVGSNGWSTGPHLHFEIHDSSDTPIDPWAWLEDEQAIDVGEEACS